MVVIVFFAILLVSWSLRAKFGRENNNFDPRDTSFLRLRGYLTRQSTSNYIKLLYLYNYILYIVTHWVFSLAGGTFFCEVDPKQSKCDDSADFHALTYAQLVTF